LIYSVKSNIKFAENNGSNVKFVQNIQSNIIHAQTQENKSDIKYAQIQEIQEKVILSKEPESLEDLEEDIIVNTAASKVDMLEIWNERREKKKKVCKKQSWGAASLHIIYCGVLSSRQLLQIGSLT